MLLGALNADLLQTKILPAALSLLGSLRPDLTGMEAFLKGKTLRLAGLLRVLLGSSGLLFSLGSWGRLFLGRCLQGFRGLSSIALIKKRAKANALRN